MILTGPEIRREVLAGKIKIVPFARGQLNPNSYNYRLGPCVLVLGEDGVSVKTKYDLRDDPLILMPRRVYLGHTAEIVGSEHYVTMLNGRSSLGRLGMFLNFSADLGNLGPAHQWTLEIKVVQPLRIYFGIKVGQASFWVPKGPIAAYRGQYARRSDPTPNLHWVNRRS